MVNKGTHDVDTENPIAVFSLLHKPMVQSACVSHLADVNGFMVLIDSVKYIIAL